MIMTQQIKDIRISALKKFRDKALIRVQKPSMSQDFSDRLLVYGALNTRTVIPLTLTCHRGLLCSPPGKRKLEGAASSAPVRGEEG